LITPENFNAVGDWYVEFPQTTDEEVCSLLEKANAALGRPAGSPQRP
jgi:predicted phosphoribosyltransferase